MNINVTRQFASAFVEDCVKYQNEACLWTFCTLL